MVKSNFPCLSKQHFQDNIQFTYEEEKEDWETTENPFIKLNDISDCPIKSVLHEIYFK